ncbi:hypothetical protein Syun_020192 [Stephania yunnanensis]|uniref:Bidirectional sugar transporter SWEET n=1 Tax=Stephania yunnanensis TaxID=152371 RepID=A0AAP0NPR9_9MAGN
MIVVTTGGEEKGWLRNDLNQSKLHNFYGSLAAISVVNFLVYLVVANSYRVLVLDSEEISSLAWPTFYRVYKKKSTEGFQSVPYVVALFSAMLWMYYALKTGTLLLISVNSFGCFIETAYIALYLTYAPKAARIFTAKLLLLLNMGGFCLVLLFTRFAVKGTNRVHVLGGICVAFSVAVFAAPLSIMRLVIKTKSVEFMPFSLSFFLTLSAIAWFCYGFLLKDLYIALPNVLGFTFGLIQMVLYAIYKNKNKIVREEKLPQSLVEVAKQEKVANCEDNEASEEESKHDQENKCKGGESYQHLRVQNCRAENCGVDVLNQVPVVNVCEV